MKLFIAVTALTLSTSAFAKPIDMICTTNAAVSSVRSFKLSGIDTAQPEVSIYDAPFQEMKEDRALVDISFSSECESSYRMVFSSYAMDDLKAGKTKKINGLFIYDNPELAEIKNGGKDAASESVLVTCSVKK